MLLTSIDVGNEGRLDRAGGAVAVRTHALAPVAGLPVLEVIGEAKHIRCRPHPRAWARWCSTIWRCNGLHPHRSSSARSHAVNPISPIHPHHPQGGTS
ncbi:hypothetical protein ACU4GD_16015 [Cupriavidus basilensis]